jgi:predicted metal-binding protein
VSSSAKKIDTKIATLGKATMPPQDPLTSRAAASAARLRAKVATDDLAFHDQHFPHPDLGKHGREIWRKRTLAQLADAQEEAAKADKDAEEAEKAKKAKKAEEGNADATVERRLPKRSARQEWKAEERLHTLHGQTLDTVKEALEGEYIEGNRATHVNTGFRPLNLNELFEQIENANQSMDDDVWREGIEALRDDIRNAIKTAKYDDTFKQELDKGLKDVNQEVRALFIEVLPCDEVIRLLEKPMTRSTIFSNESDRESAAQRAFSDQFGQPPRCPPASDASPQERIESIIRSYRANCEWRRWIDIIKNDSRTIDELQEFRLIYYGSMWSHIEDELLRYLLCVVDLDKDVREGGVRITNLLAILLERACDDRKNVDVVRRILDIVGIDKADMIEKSGALVEACIQGNTDVVPLLLKVPGIGATLRELQIVTGGGYVEILGYLLDSAYTGEDDLPSAVDVRTVAGFVVKSCHDVTNRDVSLKMLLNFKGHEDVPVIGAQYVRDEELLEMAIIGGDASIVALLFDVKGDGVDIADIGVDDAKSHLVTASSYGYHQVVDVLLMQGLHSAEALVAPPPPPLPPPLPLWEVQLNATDSSSSMTRHVRRALVFACLKSQRKTRTSTCTSDNYVNYEKTADLLLAVPDAFEKSNDALIRYLVENIDTSPEMTNHLLPYLTGQAGGAPAPTQRTQRDDDGVSPQAGARATDAWTAQCQLM